MNIGPDSLVSLVRLLTTRAPSDSAREDRMTAAAEARLRDAKAAVETMKQRRSQASEERKAIACQKVEQLKARLQALRAMASVDPKGTARMAAQLARELGAAVKAYAAAGGTTTGMETGAAPATDAGAQTAGTESGDAAQATTGEAGAVARTDPAQADGEAGSESGGAEGGDKDGGGAPANPYQQAIDEQNARADETARRGAEKQADTDFMAEVRKLAAELKALVRQAADKKPDDKDALSPGEAADLKAMVAGMDREIAQATADLGGGLSLLV